MTVGVTQMDKSALETEALEALYAYQEAFSRADAAFEARQDARSRAEQQCRIVLELEKALEATKQALEQCRGRLFMATEKLGYMPGYDAPKRRHLRGAMSSF
jgi:hypothetical protein